MIADNKLTVTSWLRQRRPLSLARVPTLVWIVIGSRFLVIASGVIGGMIHRIGGWQGVDPTRLSSSFGSVGNLLLSSSVRWDSIHYLGIAAQWYKPAADTGFFPFYPLLIRVVGWVVSSDVIAALLISAASFGIGLVLLHRITREELGERVADATVLLLAFAPLTLFFTAVYTESLFLALSVGTFYLARQGRFTWACVTAACASLTHVEGITLWAPVAYMFWQAHGERRSLRPLLSRDGAALLLPPGAFVGLLAYFRLLGFGWLAPFTGSTPTGYGYSISPIIPPGSGLGRHVVGPFITIWDALVAGASGIAATLDGTRPLAPGAGNLFSVGFQNVVYLIVLLIALTALSGVWRLLPKAYGIYATLVILVFTMSVVDVIPLRALDRYMMPLFPLWMVAAKWLNERKLLRIVVTFSALLAAFYTLEFARWVMVA